MYTPLPVVKEDFKSINLSLGAYLIDLNRQINIIRSLKEQADRVWDRLVDEKTGSHLISSITIAKTKSDAINTYCASLSKFVLSSSHKHFTGFTNMTLLSKNTELSMLKGFISATPNLDPHKLFSFVMTHMFGVDEAFTLLSLMDYPNRASELKAQLIYVTNRFQFDEGWVVQDDDEMSPAENMVNTFINGTEEEVDVYYNNLSEAVELLINHPTELMNPLEFVINQVHEIDSKK